MEDFISTSSAIMSILAGIAGILTYLDQRQKKSTKTQKSGRIRKAINWLSQRPSLILFLFAFSASLFLAALLIRQLEEKMDRRQNTMTQEIQELKKGLENHQEAALLTLEASEATSGNKDQDAHEILKRAIRIEAKNPYILKRLADAESRLGLHKSALENYRKATEIRDDYKAAYQGQVFALYNLKQPLLDEAIDVFVNHIKNNEPNAKDLYVGGKAYSLKWVHKGNNFTDDEYYNTAKDLYTQCIDSASSWRPWCYYNLACLQANRLSDPEVKNNRQSFETLSDSAIDYLESSYLNAGDLKQDVRERICNDETLNNIKSRINQVVDCT